MASQKILNQKTLKLARECLVLFQDARRAAVVDQVSTNPSDSVGLAYCFERYDNFKKAGNFVLWELLMALPSERFAIPVSFPCGVRYNTTLSGNNLFSALDNFCSELSAYSAFHSEIRNVYKNFAIRAALRFGYAVERPLAFADVLVCGGAAASKDASAVFDLDELLYPNRTNSPEALGDVLDPSIFDRARAEADAVHAESGVF